MLQDLDALSQRIQQIVQLAGSLQSERRALQARIRQLEQESQVLKDQYQREQTEFTRMSERIARHDKEIQAARDESLELRTALEAQVREQQARADELQQRLGQVETDRGRLRQAATGARQQIQSILERLPGAEA
jgi:predicted  nucleic acid-binding Zn-ribbon protein